jgi:hypothetical protein
MKFTVEDGNGGHLHLNLHQGVDAFIEETACLSKEDAEVYHIVRRVHERRKFSGSLDMALRWVYLALKDGQPDLTKDLSYARATYRRHKAQYPRCVELVKNHRLERIAQSLFCHREEMPLLTPEKITEKFDLSREESLGVLAILQNNNVKAIEPSKEKGTFTWSHDVVWELSDTMEGRQMMWGWLRSMFGKGGISFSECVEVRHIELKFCGREAKAMARYLHLSNGNGCVGPSRTMAVKMEEQSKRRAKLPLDAAVPENVGVTVLFAETSPEESPDKWLRRIIRDSDPRNFPRIMDVWVDETGMISLKGRIDNLHATILKRATELGAAVVNKPLDNDVSVYRITILVKVHKPSEKS